jgi:eukaryotic-like serine/threonine-protein kinase
VVEAASVAPERVLGRYALYDEIASGGMATVHVGRLMGPVGFSRTVAIKRLRSIYVEDPEFVSMFLDEARLAARIQHPNVVPTLDVIQLDHEIFLVMEYVKGESLAKLIRAARAAKRPIEPGIACAVMSAVLHGLHAAHEARTEQGEPLHIVHRDVSPHNVLVGIDGVARVLDFGVAKAADRVQTTKDGQVKGKVAYMAPEQVRGHATRQTDVYAAAVVLWEALVQRRLFEGDNPAVTFARVVAGEIEPPSKFVPGLPSALDQVTMRGLARDPAMRFATAREMARTLEKIVPLAPASEIGEWVEELAGEGLRSRSALVARIESQTSAAPHARQASSSGLVPLSVATIPDPIYVGEGAAALKVDTIPERAWAASSPSPVSAVREAGAAPEEVVASGTGVTTSLGVEAPPAPAPARRLGRTVLGVLVAVGLASWGAVALLHFGKRGATTSATSSRPPDAIEAWPAGPDLGQAPAPSLTAASEAPATAPVVASISASAAPSTPATVEPPGSAASARATSHPPPSPAKNPCNPPWTVDANGDRHYKRECLGR